MSEAARQEDHLYPVTDDERELNNFNPKTLANLHLALNSVEEKTPQAFVDLVDTLLRTKLEEQERETLVAAKRLSEDLEDTPSNLPAIARLYDQIRIHARKKNAAMRRSYTDTANFLINTLASSLLQGLYSKENPPPWATSE